MPYGKAKKKEIDASRIRGLNWAFTVFLHPEDPRDLTDSEDEIKYVDELTKAIILGCAPARWIYQIELPDTECQHIHAQGYMEFHSQKAFKTIKKVNNWFHFEKRKRGASRRDNVVYCSKPEGRVYGPFYKGLQPPTPIRDPLATVALYPWQHQILFIADTEPDDRSIWWFWEQEGNAGKSALVKHMYLTLPGAVFATGEKWNDIACHIMDHVVPRTTTGRRNDRIDDPVPPRYILLDIPRSARDSLHLAGLESVKNGLFFSGKYEPRTGPLNPPHIFVFANYPPPFPDELSPDRWRIARIEGRTWADESMEVFNDVNQLLPVCN